MVAAAAASERKSRRKHESGTADEGKQVDCARSSRRTIRRGSETASRCRGRQQATRRWHNEAGWGRRLRWLGESAAVAAARLGFGRCGRRSRCSGGPVVARLLGAAPAADGGHGRRRVSGDGGVCSARRGHRVEPAAQAGGPTAGGGGDDPRQRPPRATRRYRHLLCAAFQLTSSLDGHPPTWRPPWLQSRRPLPRARSASAAPTAPQCPTLELLPSLPARRWMRP